MISLLQRSNKVILYFLVFTSFASFLAGCVPQKNVANFRNAKSSAEINDPNDPNDKAPAEDPIFTDESTYLQNGSEKSISTMFLPAQFSTGIYLRGKNIHLYIKNFGINNTQCISAYFPTSMGHKYLVVTAAPHFFTNFSTKSKEYYYWIDINNQGNNQALCQTAGIVSELTSTGDTIAYALKDVCPNGCGGGTILSQPLVLRESIGPPITNISIQNLTLRIDHAYDGGGSNIGTGPSCSANSHCTGQGFDCCSNGYCINDKEVKNGVNTSSQDFLDAMEAIGIDPNHIYDYPEFFHFCAVGVVPTPTTTPTIDPNVDLYERFMMLKEAYECSTPLEGEMSICTIKYEDIETTPGPFYTLPDDRNFQTTYSGITPPPSHSIYEIEAYGVPVFKVGSLHLPGVNIGPNNNLNGNDTLSDALQVDITNSFTKPYKPKNNDIKIKYKIDGSCTQINSLVARCEKYYVQGQNSGRVDDHYPGSNDFKLPAYADTNMAIQVDVDGIAQLQNLHYKIVSSSVPKMIQFLQNGLPSANTQVYDTQTVKITFFAQLGSNPNLLMSKNKALQKINDLCGCPDFSCWLTPTYETLNGVTTIKDYVCGYPQNDNTLPPLQQTVYLSNKSVPVRFFDSNGAPHSEITYDTPAQEGLEFKYTNGDLLKPNNLDNHIGFNEIYGSLTVKPTSAQPAKEVKVKINKLYDIFVDQGIFSNCYYCGTDYYTSAVKIWPSNTISKGGGYSPLPDLFATNAQKTTTYRKDDLIFGRACFVPTTMIPWTHSPEATVELQRRRRLEAQHFLFSNGYQRDWYGFDYGSIIGSFDGVRWFSVGSQRRIKATSNRLYLAVNAYFGDQTIDSDFVIVVSDATAIPTAGSSVMNDFDSDGAECQRMHQCSTDRDCVTQLGWDYACETVSNIRTDWPRFDHNGREIPNEKQSRTIYNLIAPVTGGAKRCVYRGRGAPCVPDYNISDPMDSYAQSIRPRVNACSDNNYCQTLMGGGNQSFNTKISRYGKSIKTLNATTGSTHNIFGLDSPLLGRPEKYNGTNAPAATVTNTLKDKNNVQAICLPGRDPLAGSTFTDNHSKKYLSIQNGGDRVNGIGVTGVSTNGLPQEHFLQACNIFDIDGNYYKMKSGNLNKNVSDPDFIKLANSQVLSTRLLQKLQTLAGLDGSQNSILKNFTGTDSIQAIALENNRCLRAPGSPCHTDLDCAPSKYIASKVASIIPATLDTGENNGWGTTPEHFNRYEIAFWKEELICSQPYPKTHDDYNHRNNYCCREVGKTINIPTFIDQFSFGINIDTKIPNFNNYYPPGLDYPPPSGNFTPISLDDNMRYSRNATHQDILTDISGEFPPLEAMRKDSCYNNQICGNILDLEKQFRTFAKIAERTSCTGHWVRKFASSSNGGPGNGGGNKWGPNKTQNIKLESFECLNWSSSQRTCAGLEGPDDPDCDARNISNSEAKPIFNWLMTLELTGIPQIAIRTDVNAIGCKDGTNAHLPGIIKASHVNTNDANKAIPEYGDPNNGGEAYFSSTDFGTSDGNYQDGNFADGIKPIFSADEIVTCHPVGAIVPDSTDPKLCCTGFLNYQASGLRANQAKCQLPDYSNVSVFFNRYVSSAAKNVTPQYFDPKTGYINSIALLQQLACTERVCASGLIGRGIVLSNLKVKGQINSGVTRRRFLDGPGQENNMNGLVDLYKAGLRWNESLYCLPEDAEGDLYTISCGN